MNEDDFDIFKDYEVEYHIPKLPECIKPICTNMLYFISYNNTILDSIEFNDKENFLYATLYNAQQIINTKNSFEKILYIKMYPSKQYVYTDNCILKPNKSIHSLCFCDAHFKNYKMLIANEDERSFKLFISLFEILYNYKDPEEYKDLGWIENNNFNRNLNKVKTDILYKPCKDSYYKDINPSNYMTSIHTDNELYVVELKKPDITDITVNLLKIQSLKDL